jgi:copper homeostasis protein
VLFEVCIDSVESALSAQQGGADRIELCADLDQGGTTPGVGAIQSVRAAVSLKMHVMIRPRAGGFCYSDAEIRDMIKDIGEAKKLGADGVVFGVLMNDGRVDSPATARLVEAARPMSVTFHRAFDDTPNLFAALSELTRLGVDRILTSGGKPSVEAGMEALAALVRNAGSSPIILVGGGITLENVTEVVKKTGASEIHALSCVSGIEPSSPESKHVQSPRKTVDVTKVRQMVDILRLLRAKS